MPALHLIENEGYIFPTENSEQFESGYWAFEEDTARGFVGWNIYFHKQQKEPSFDGGRIIDIRISRGHPVEYNGRIIFLFERSKRQRNRRRARGLGSVEKYQSILKSGGKPSALHTLRDCHRQIKFRHVFAGDVLRVTDPRSASAYLLRRLIKN